MEGQVPSISYVLYFLLIFTSFIVFLYSITIRSRKSTNLPPGPKPLPIIGNLLELGEKPHISLTKLANIHGPIMALKLGQVTSVVISSSTMAKEILQTHDQSLSYRTIPDALRAHSHHQAGLPWMPPSTLWRNLRKICNTNLFAAKILDDNRNLRREKLERLLSSVRESALRGESVDIGKAAFMTSLNLLSNTVFSVDLADPNSELAMAFIESARGIMEEAGKPNFGDYFVLMRKMDFQGIRKRAEKHVGMVLDIIEHMIEQRLELQKLPNGSDPIHNDLLHQLLHVNEGNAEFKIERRELKHLILVLFVAGTDTTAATLQWAMAELLRNPETMSTAKEELNQVIGKGNLVEESDVSRLPYLQAIVKETFRLHPAIPLLLPRKSQKDVQIAGFTIPKDSQVITNAWAIGRDPKLWENPDSFIPNRFLGSDVDVRGRNFELIPFGGGRRICPGLPLAMRMLYLMLGSLVNSFDWKLEEGMSPDDMDMDEKFGISLEMASPLRAVPCLV